MAAKPDIARIVRDQDTAALEEAMRYGGDPGVRRRAAQAAGKLGGYDLIEALNRALREDPDLDVQRDAYQALTDILGNRAPEVIASYNTGPVYEDEWLIEEAEEELEGEIPADWEMDDPARAGVAAWLPNLNEILEAGDVEALEEAMRYGPDVKVRQLAVRAAGQRENYDLIEALTRSLREDPENVVREEANRALQELLGNRSEETIASYKGADYADEWIITEFPEEGDGGELSGVWDESSLHALFTIASDDRDEAKGVKAVRALAQISSTRAVEALIALALRAASTRVRDAARAELEAFYGEDLDQVLESYRTAGQDDLEEFEEGEEEDQAEDEAAGEDWVELPQRGSSIRQAPPDQPSVFKEEGMDPVTTAIIVVGVLVVIGLVMMVLGQ